MFLVGDGCQAVRLDEPAQHRVDSERPSCPWPRSGLRRWPRLTGCEIGVTSRPVDDDADVCAYPYRPEIFVLGLIQLVEAQSRIGGIQLEVKRCGFDRLLLVPVESHEAVSEGIGR